MGKLLEPFHILKHRSQESEWLDDLSLKGPELEKSLSQLGRINQVLGTHRSIKSAFTQLIKGQLKFAKTDKIHIVDLACGGGDVLKMLAEWGRKHDYQFRLTGLEGNPESVRYAQKNTATYQEISFEVIDIMSPNFELPQCDILISSQFLYHFSDADLAAFLQKIKKRVRMALISSDLQRSVLAYWGFQLISRLAAFNAMTRHDGLLAIRRAFRRKELVWILDQAGFHRYRIRWNWAFRFQVMMICNS